MSGLDDRVFEFREPLLQKSIADTLLDSQIRHVMEKIDTLPIAGLKAKSWAIELLHPFLLHKYQEMRAESRRMQSRSHNALG